jgi:hypothetical protein
MREAISEHGAHRRRIRPAKLAIRAEVEVGKRNGHGVGWARHQQEQNREGSESHCHPPVTVELTTLLSINDKTSSTEHVNTLILLGTEKQTCAL